jgi:hypothetical protein
VLTDIIFNSDNTMRKRKTTMRVREGPFASSLRVFAVLWSRPRVQQGETIFPTEHRNLPLRVADEGKYLYIIEIYV